MDHSYLAYKVIEEFSRLNFKDPHRARTVIENSRDITKEDCKEIFKDKEPIKVIGNWLAVKLAKVGRIQSYWEEGWIVLHLPEPDCNTFAKVKQKEGVLEFKLRQQITWKEYCAEEIPTPKNYKEFTQIIGSAKYHGFSYDSMLKLANKLRPAQIPLFYHQECLMFQQTAPLREESPIIVTVEAEVYHGTPIEWEKKVIGPHDRVTLKTTVGVKKPKQELTLPDKLF